MTLETSIMAGVNNPWGPYYANTAAAPMVMKELDVRFERGNEKAPEDLKWVKLQAFSVITKNYPARARSIDEMCRGGEMLSKRSLDDEFPIGHEPTVLTASHAQDLVDSAAESGKASDVQETVDAADAQATASLEDDARAFLESDNWQPLRSLINQWNGEGKHELAKAALAVETSDLGRNRKSLVKALGDAIGRTDPSQKWDCSHCGTTWTGAESSECPKTADHE